MADSTTSKDSRIALGNVLVINGQTIPWSFYWKVVKMLNGDRDAANRVMFRAHCAAPANVIAWISKGFLPDDKGKRYALTPCKQEENGSGPTRAWIDANLVGKYKGKQMAAVGGDLKKYLHQLAESL